MELSEQIGRFLDARGLGTFSLTSGGNIFINRSPSSPDEALSVYLTGGPASDPRNEYGRTNFQVVIRTKPNDVMTGERIAREMVNALNGFSSQPLVDGGYYIIDTVALQNGPNGIGQDQSFRFEYSQNFTIEYVK